jgi:8-oxo-dGTP pyrophosphatase MutT (NUDIX family)
MLQMYTVFVNDKPIIFTDSLIEGNRYPVCLFKNLVVEEILYKLKSDHVEGIKVFCKDVAASKQFFFQKFKVIIAAGGLVLNSKNEILFIYRGNRWDLPKGRVEKGETIEAAALREVEEECGIENLVIDTFLATTHHYFYHKENRIKETHWFIMRSDYQGTLTPQLEEGITNVVFKNEKEVVSALKNTYANIALVVKKYKNLLG